VKISASFLKIQDKEDKILQLDKYTDYMHYDVMDGNFTESKTPSLIGFNIEKPKDVHLMVTELKEYIDLYSTINPLFMTFHIEATDRVMDIINYIKSKGIKVGLALNPDTPVDELFPYLEYIDMVLVMSVVPGKGGQPFIDITNKIDKLDSYRQLNDLNYLIEVDGGINDKTAGLVRKADILVSGSYITDSDNYLDKINNLRSMFMGKKGFTLAELMAVIVIIAIIAVIATTTVDRSIKNSRYDTCQAQEKNIIEGAKMWSTDNASKLPIAGQSVTVSLTALQNGNYIEDGLKSPMTNGVYSSGSSVVISSSNGTSYEYVVKYGNDKENCTK